MYLYLEYLVTYCFVIAGNPNKSDLLKGSTPVHYAASNSHAEVLRVLLRAGGKYDCKNNHDETCLDVAEGFECQKILRQQRMYYD